MWLRKQVRYLKKIRQCVTIQTGGNLNSKLESKLSSCEERTEIYYCSVQRENLNDISKCSDLQAGTSQGKRVV